MACLICTSCLKVEEVPSKEERINLAMRQVGDRLYRYCGDRTSLIPPVQVLSDIEFQLQLDQGVEYDILQELMEKTFNDFGIADDYIVSILDCYDNEILLGFNTIASDSETQPCGGRDRVEQCNIINLKLYDAEKSINQTSNWIYSILGSLIFIGLIWSRYKNRKPQSESNTDSELATNQENPSVESKDLKIGNSSFDVQSLSFSHKDESKTLTYREAKLFEYFVVHKNEVLKREDIQNHVWEEEGVIVGRSLDVFISRLRKIIKADQSLAIKNIHGVGYRLEEKL